MVAYRSKMEIIGDILVSAEEKTIEQDGASIMHLIKASLTQKIAHRQ